MKMGFISFLIVYLVLFKDSGTLFFKDSENILDEYFDTSAYMGITVWFGDGCPGKKQQCRRHCRSEKYTFGSCWPGKKLCVCSKARVVPKLKKKPW